MSTRWAASMMLLLATMGWIAPSLAQGPGAPASWPGQVSGPIAQVCRLPPVETVPSPAPMPPADPRGETLQQAWDAALAYDRTVQARQWEVGSARQRLGLAEAQRWPNADVESSYHVRSARPAFSSEFMNIPGVTGSMPFAQNEYFALRTAVDVPLYTSGRISRGIDAATAGVKASSYELDKTILDVRLATAQEYVAVLRAQRDVEIAQSSVKSLDSHARDVRILFENDRVPKNDVLAAEVALANARQRAIQVANRLDAARAAYNRRLGRPLNESVNLAELERLMPRVDLDALTARALDRRPEMAMLDARIRALGYRAEHVRAAGSPQVNLRGEYALEENRYRSPDGIAAAGVVVSWNVFDAGRRNFQAGDLTRQAQSLRQWRADTESLIRLDVRRAWLDVQETHRRIEVTEKAVHQAEENLRVATNRYQAGLAINTEVLDAETLRTQAYGNYHGARYDAALALFHLQHATADLGCR
ncbi:MAG: TolC family protein [Pirellulales bacterium]|nr:TolC family protein [Pirellulales bacterium]